MDTTDGVYVTAEERRLREAREGVPWRRWGPYLSERQWGTVREDYSDGGDAWNYFSHDQARSRAYRWGEDGLAGVSDDRQRLCFALALWNGADPILKERLFGLTNSEGNHGEDVKEYYFYLDNLPSHAYMRWLYKYPQAAFPYLDLLARNRERSRYDLEHELIDTGVFRDNRYFDVEVEYAKAGPEDLVARITVHNRGPEAAAIHLLPTVWFRNTWSWPPHTQRPRLWSERGAVRCEHHRLGGRVLHVEGGPELLFCENETNARRLWGATNPTPYVKDGINDRVVAGRLDAVNPEQVGTKAAAHVRLVVSSGATATIRARLTPEPMEAPFEGCDELIAARRQEADEFYDVITPPAVDAERRVVMRQALAGMLWTKQYYDFDVDTWLSEHQAHPFRPPTRSGVRNERWYHMHNDDIISMPDKW
ncbi:MAG: glucosidase, partial [Chloroflexi bacterium]